MTAIPKPPRRGRKPKHPIKRRARPRSRLASRFGDYRARVKYANDLWRHLVYAKEPNGWCPCCRKRRWHDAAHGWAKGPHPALRFELMNGIPLCRPCHRRVDSDHQAKRDLWIRYYGVGPYCALELRAASRPRMDLGLTILYLEDETRKAKARIEAMNLEWPIKPSRG